MTLGEKIIKYRGENNLTQVQFAELCKVSEKLIIDIEHNRRKPHALTISKISKVLEG